MDFPDEVLSSKVTVFNTARHVANRTDSTNPGKKTTSVVYCIPCQPGHRWIQRLCLVLVRVHWKVDANTIS